VRILDKLIEKGDATCFELELLLSLVHQTASARIAELKQENRIIDTGKKRLTERGYPASVYKINEEMYGLGSSRTARHDKN